VLPVGGAGAPGAGDLAFGDLDGLERALGRFGDEVAAVVVEPVATHAGLLDPAPGYLAGVRALADRHGALLVFDEVRAGWRIGPGGATARAGVPPDLVTMGDWLGAGMPIGAVGGRADVLAAAAAGRGGTGASPLAVAAALACATAVLTDAAHAAMEARAVRLAGGLRAIAEAYALPLRVTRVGAAGSVLFTGRPRAGGNGAGGGDPAAWRRWWLAMLNHGVIPMPPAWHEPWTVSAAHTDADVDHAVDAAEAAFGRVFGM
jgi:glutamate-1-semialdehyde 2,1-aminomutase